MSAPLWVAIALGLNLFLFKPGLGNASVEVDFTRPDLADQPVHLSDYRSQWVVVNFWATWCGPCRMVGPVVDELAGDYEGKAVVGKLNVDSDGAVAQQFGVRNIPTLLVFKNGEIVDKQVGATSKQVLAAKLDGAM